VEKLVEQFEEAWQTGRPPRLGDFLAFSPAGEQRALLLEELVKVDLECRWSLGTPERPRLEDYAARFPELGRPERLAVELIGEEYRVRQRWGDHPSHAEYIGRFRQQGPALLEALHRIDAELTAEFRALSAGSAHEIKGASPSPPPKDGREPEQPILSVAALIDGLRQQQLVSQAQLDTIVGDLQRRFPDPRALGKELLERGWLTAYQLNQLAMGHGADLVMGPYRVLERLGEGGMGQVFKARHQRLERIVALKLIRKELLADQEIVSRFYREIQIISGLEHANIIRAYDAGPIGPTHFLAMEYVEGTDLQRLVRQSGPLPPAQACNYVRQAALGLQYAHEKGLVHRDIKPSNLLLLGARSASKGDHGVASSVGVIKILDLGLARLHRNAVNNDSTSEGGTQTLTPAGGVMMGTPDYAAPEQALDFHQADIRADIYSLGCTLFFLLSGQPPFAGGTIMQRLWRHQAEPPVLDKLSRDTPTELMALLRRMLAKRPEDRPQTPAEVAAAMEPFLTLQTPPGRPAIVKPQPRRQGRRWAAAVAVLTVSAALIFTLVLIRSGDPPKTEAQPTESRSLPVPTKPAVAELEGPFPVGRPGPTKSAAIGAVSSDGRWAAYLADKKLVLCKRETQKERVLPLEDADKTESLAFSADGKYLGVLAAKMVRVWAVDKDDAPLIATAGRNFAFAGNSQKLVVLGDDSSLAYDLNDPRAPASLPRSDGAGALSEDGGWFAYTVDRDDQKLSFIQVKKTSTPLPANRVGHARKVFALTFAPNRSILAVTETLMSGKGQIHLVDYASPRDRTNDFAISTKAPAPICFAGNLLLAVSVPDQIHCWSVSRHSASGRILASKLKEWTLPGPILAVAARDRVAAILLGDGRLYLLHLPEVKEP
jgi:serine/threonine-protein kinase